MTQFTDERGRRTLADFVPIREVYAAGRLDFDSEGLLVLTSNGQLQQRLSDPRFEHPKTYWVQVEGEVTAQALEALRGGVTVQEYRTKPCEATSMAEPHWPERDPPIRMRKTIPTSWIELTLREGRNRQVRRMTAAVGFPTLRLIRIGIGPIALGDLAPGGWRDLTESEMRAIIRIPAGAP